MKYLERRYTLKCYPHLFNFLFFRSLESSSRMAIDLQSVSAASSCSHHSGSVVTDDDVSENVLFPRTLSFFRFVSAEPQHCSSRVSWTVIVILSWKQKPRHWSSWLDGMLSGTWSRRKRSDRKWSTVGDIRMTKVLKLVFSELFHTERTHVRNLKILYHVFYKPIVSNKMFSDEISKLLFANLEELLNLHKSMSDAMRAEVEKVRLQVQVKMQTDVSSGEQHLHALTAVFTGTLAC